MLPRKKKKKKGEKKAEGRTDGMGRTGVVYEGVGGPEGEGPLHVLLGRGDVHDVEGWLAFHLVAYRSWCRCYFILKYIYMIYYSFSLEKIGTEPFDLYVGVDRLV